MNPMSPQNPDDPNAPRRRTEGAVKRVPWAGCPLLPANPEKMVKEGARLGLKLELKGWQAAGDVPDGKCKDRVPVDLIKNLDMTPDDIHRLYGHGIYFVHLYELSETDGLTTPIYGETLTLSPCKFTRRTRTDPRDPEEDVGKSAWPVPESRVANDPTLAEEMDRRNEVRMDLEGDDEDDFEGDDRADEFSGGGHGRRGGRQWGSDRGGSPAMRAFGGNPARDEWKYNQAVRPTATPPPGQMWVFSGDPMQWHHEEVTAELLAQQRAAAQALLPPAPAPVEKTPFHETAVGATLLGTLATVGGAIIQKMMEPKPPPPDPMAALAALMAAIQPKTDPAAIKQLELDAEDRRARREAEAREAAEARAEAQRKHERELAEARLAADAKLAEERRIAAEAAEIARDERARRVAKEDSDRLVQMSQLGLTEKKGMTPEQIEAVIAARVEAAAMKTRLDFMERQAAAKAPGAVGEIKAAKELLTAAGVMGGEGDSAASMFDSVMNSPAAPALVAMLDKFLSPTPAQANPGAQMPTPEQIEAEVQRRAQQAFQQYVQRTAPPQVPLATEPAPVYLPQPSPFAVVPEPAPAPEAVPAPEPVPEPVPEPDAVPAPQEDPDSVRARADWEAHQAMLAERRAAEAAASEAAPAPEEAPAAPQVEPTPEATAEALDAATEAGATAESAVQTGMVAGEGTEVAA